MLDNAHIYIAIDSADRDQSRFPNPASYTYDLPSVIRNADSITVMMLQMVRTESVINASNSTFMLNVGSTNWTVTVQIGEWTTTSALAGALQSALQAKAGSGMTVAVSSTGYLTISHSAAFSVTMPAPLARIFGFKPVGSKNGTVSAAFANSTWSIIASKMAEPFGEPYIYLNINDYERNTGITAAGQRSFMMVPLESHTIGSRFLMCSDEKEHVIRRGRGAGALLFGRDGRGLQAGLAAQRARHKDNFHGRQGAYPPRQAV